jgi:aryl-alcohol dehydrogenase-like predicted oxidoreductase
VSAVRPLEGFATKAGTAAYRARVAATTVPAHFRAWDGLALSSIGIGTYLGGADAAGDRAYEAAVTRALELGINVVDSAINYRHQRSERAIGAALQALVAAGKLARAEVVVATKGGFLPGDGAALVRPDARFVEAYVRPGILAAADLVAGSHCLAPRYLADQLDRSLANLGLSALDVYYLHNPETQLQEVDRPVFAARMRAAFEFLEGAVAAGKIRRYGAATWNGFRQAPSAPDYLSLDDLVTLAASVAGRDHHFRVLQLPYNLGMTEAFTTQNQRAGGKTMSLMGAARRLELFVTTSASLHQGGLVRGLSPVIAEFLPGLESDAQRAIQFARSTPGVGAALVGMQHLDHVEENARLGNVPPLPWSRFKRLFQGEESA